MDYLVPDYYGEFACIADKCSDTCCAGWQIMIDEDSMKKYEEYPGGFGNRLANSIDPDQKCFLQYNKRCAFLNEENLCDICIEAGKDMLCKTCRDFPRHTEEYENVREVSLSIACPEAARILLSRKAPVKLMEKETEGEEEYEDFDYMFFSTLLDARDVMFTILAQENATIYEKMGTILSLGHDLQRRIRNNELFLSEDMTRQYKEQGIQAFRQKVAEPKKRFLLSHQNKKNHNFDRMKAMHDIYHLFYQMEVLEDDWIPLVKEAEKQLYGQGEQHYEELTKEPVDQMVLQQIMWYFLYTYFAGAVYDYLPNVKVKMAVVSTLLIQELLFARRAEKGSLDIEDYVDIAHRYAKEIEHSEDNVETMEEKLRTQPVYGILPLVYGCLK